MASNKKKKRIMLVIILSVIAVVVIGTVIAAAILKSDNSGMTRAEVADTETKWTKVQNLGTAAAAPDKLDDNYKKVAESTNYAMYLFEDTMSVKLLNRVTGEITETTLSDEKNDGSMNKTWTGSMKSGFNAYVIKGSKNSYSLDLVTAKHTIKYKYIKNGFIATLYFSAYGLGCEVQVVLDGDSLVATVPYDSIKEDKDDNYFCSISLFPFLGYTYKNDSTGYMFVPDGNGALIYLQDTEGRFASAFSQMIYGDDAGRATASSSNLLEDKYHTVNDPDPVIMPVFGMAHTDNNTGFLAIVEKGDERASIEAQPAGVYINYNRCFAKFYLRDNYVQPLNNSNSGTVIKAESMRTNSDLQIRFILLSGDNANYTGMAKIYREYLVENGQLSETDTSFNSRVDFLGSDNEKWLAFRTPVAMTTVDQVEEIYKLLREKGVDNVLSLYKGWQKGGIYSVPVSKFNTSSALGGNSSLVKLIADSAKENYKLYLYVNAMEANPDEENTTFSTVKKINKRRLEIQLYGEVYDKMNYLLPTKADSALSSLIKDMNKNGVENLALAGVSSNLYSFTYNGGVYTRKDTQQAFEKMIADASKSTKLVLEMPFEYLWNYTGAFLDTPLESSHYMYLDEEVPFLSIVLKGSIPMYSDYVNFEANKQEFFLKMVESGVYPSFYLTYEDSSKLLYTNSSDLYSTLYSTYVDTVAEYDSKLGTIASKVGSAKIDNHEKLANGLVKVTYDNGVIIYVNYTEDSLSDGSTTVGAMSYEVISK